MYDWLLKLSDIKSCEIYRFLLQTSDRSLQICSYLFDVAGNKCGFSSGTHCV
mgnify:CR=1 FL=1